MDLTPFLRIAATRRFAVLERMDVVSAQERALLHLTERARDTEFGRAHGFAAIRSVGAFQRQVPVRQFDDFWDAYWKDRWPILDNVTWPGRIPFFAKTSGTTTGKTKYIPITRDIIRANERAGFDLLTYHLHHRPQSRPLSGKSFIIGGTTSLEEVAPGIFAGDVSGINTKLTPFWVKPHIFPPPELTMIPNWDEKVEAVAARAVTQRITMLSGMCNWVLVMLDRIRARRERDGFGAGPTLPDLQLLIHGGVPIDLYRARLAPHFTGSTADWRELYPTSEGFLAVADRGPGEGLRAMVDNKLFLEFIPLAEVGSANPTRHWMATIEPNIDYALVLSNCAGLWAYVLGDIVRFVQTRPPRLLIMGRIAQKLSPFGEHLIAAELDEAVRVAAQQLNIAVAEYTVGPVLPMGPSEPGYHVYLIEPTVRLSGDARQSAVRFARAIDLVLLDINYDYEGERKGDAGIAPPRVHWLAPGTFESWMRTKGKLGGQHKVPRVMPKADRFAELRRELGDHLDRADEELPDAQRLPA